MKYIEELSSGDVFRYKNELYLLTGDFKINGQRMAISLKDGFSSWHNGQTIVDKTPIFVLDTENNIIPAKIEKKDANISN